MLDSHLKPLRLLLLVLSLFLIFSCDDDDPIDQDENETIVGLWNYDSQTLEFYVNGDKLSTEEAELYFSILGYDLESFQVPEDATFEFVADGTFIGNAPDYDQQTGSWELSEDEKTLSISSNSGILFIDFDSLPDDFKNLIFEEDGSIAFEIVTLTDTDASVYISKTGPVEISSTVTLNLRTDLTINLTK
ncbi:hypothetical protein [Chondrinema litorale]|uniref:hypothetical protein n=1 Tax=Chondrinema litorale TaxID=2994555 RepID=UPI0025431D7B|nr:hypothetical protein [Chondrinema litorale]UZR95069.1 hypothetical protein OQ292_04470 [Chondrinema litorale]